MENNVNYDEIAIQVAEIGIELLQLVRYLARKRTKFRRWWSKPLIRQNYLTGYGGYENVFIYFKLEDEEQFFNFTG